MTTALYRFFWDCGRQGSLDGVFEATPQQVDDLIGREVYFGEVLGKHSEIHGTVADVDITKLTDDQDFIKKARELGLTYYGYNPLVYVEEDYNEDDDGDLDG